MGCAGRFKAWNRCWCSVPPAIAHPAHSSPRFPFPHFNTMRQVKNIIKKSPIQHVSFNKTIACQVNMSSSNFGLVPASPLFCTRLVKTCPKIPSSPPGFQFAPALPGHSTVSRHRCVQAPDLKHKTLLYNLMIGQTVTTAREDPFALSACFALSRDAAWNPAFAPAPQTHWLDERGKQQKSHLTREI